MLKVSVNKDRCPPTGIRVIRVIRFSFPKRIKKRYFVFCKMGILEKDNIIISVP